MNEKTFILVDSWQFTIDCSGTIPAYQYILLAEMGAETGNSDCIVRFADSGMPGGPVHTTFMPAQITAGQLFVCLQDPPGQFSGVE